MEKVLSGKPIAARIKANIKAWVQECELAPKMFLIQLGKDPAAEFYVQNIIATGAKLGCEVKLLDLPADTSQSQLLAEIRTANADSSIHGIMIQKPLPGHIEDGIVASSVAPEKDIDCLNPVNLGKIILEEDGLVPATPLAVLSMLKYYRITVQGARVLIIGRSSIVGKPLANMLLWKKSYANASVTVCHSRSKNLKELTRSADIVIAALGRPEFVTADMIKENCVLIDVGINEKIAPDGKSRYVGDVDYNSCLDKALAITPVPGGVGSVTTPLLFLNLLKACMAASGQNKTVDDFLGLIFDDI
ncbi:MAG: bifunctional 5,10-methylenetetrahydrofolate dehydrogenase/5,10-methenyltetrahydrofolate cyclohydrolase [Candidatus Syntrophosphaera sp.]|nr:bifunctional 5,10-methylenetetrahydrofolate dehydrogenase/5,10-methenyltetrahydrofolate cyclohydrolase [Candidatus Syntrophosphaera sp.]